MNGIFRKTARAVGALALAMFMSTGAMAGVGDGTGQTTIQEVNVPTSISTGRFDGSGYVGGRHDRYWDVTVGTLLSRELARTIATTHPQFRGTGYAGQLQQFGTLSNLEFLTSDLQQFGNAASQLEAFYTQLAQDLIAQGGRGTYNITSTYTGSEVYSLYGGEVGGGTLVGDSDNAAGGYVGAGTVTIVVGDALVDFYHVQANVFVSPLVLDLDGDAKLMASNGDWRPHTGFDKSRAALFDWNGNGFPLLTEWVGPNDGLLVDPRADGTVDGTCLYGSTTGLNDGYEAMAVRRDANNDLVVNGQELAGLKVWTDKNGDAVAQATELTNVEDLGITAINLKHDNMKSTFVRNGETQTMWDWWPNAQELRRAKATTAK
ncbi:MAG: hypothetical protein HY319_10800 [Armatimonadetes bacterium]|nr:hypothetical protein [Armatimonadota bacterium]